MTTSDKSKDIIKTPEFVVESTLFTFEESMNIEKPIFIEEVSFQATFVDVDNELWKWANGMYFDKEIKRRYK